MPQVTAIAWSAAGIAVASHCMMRIMIAVAICASCVEPASAVSTAAIVETTFANLAAVDGTVTTLAYYGNGAPHPGVNSIDVGAPGGTAVYHQIDYLGSDIAGGWIWVEPAHEAGLCSQWWPGSAYYNGAKIYVYTYFYDTAGTFVGSHRAAFQHVDPYDPNMNSWWSWNNPGAALAAWPDGATVSYGDQAAGGMYLGDVHAVGAPIYNGDGGHLCTDGSHVHQEADGWRATQRYVGEPVASRYSDLHYFTLSSATPVGDPPFPPTPAPPPPPPSGPQHSPCVDGGPCAPLPQLLR